MAINPESIERFLAYRNQDPPDVKNMSEDRLYALIANVTGRHFHPKTTPRRHQLASVAFAVAQKSAMLCVGMRMGKTATTLYLKEHLISAGLSTKPGIVIVPNPILRSVWVTEAAKHCELRVKDVNTKASEFLNALEEDYNLIIVSWSSLQSLFSVKKKNRKGENKLVPDIETIQHAAGFFDFVAIDEIHTAKNHESLRFGIGQHLFSQAEWKLGLTGTPFGRDPFSLWAQAYLLDEGECLSKSFFFFREAFGKEQEVFRGRTREQIKRSFSRSFSNTEWVFDKTKTDIIVEKLKPLVLVYENTEIKEQIEPEIVKLTMATEQRLAYEREAQEARDRMLDGEQVTSGLYSRLRRISSGYLPYEDDDTERVLEFAENPKLEWVADFLDAAGGAPTLLFHVYKHTGALLMRLCEKKHIDCTWLHGGTGSAAQYKAVNKFQTGKANVMIINVASGNAGIDLSRADYQIYVESPSGAIQRAQSEARALGAARGERPLLVVDLMASKVDLKVLASVKEGRDLLQEIIYNPLDLV